jgi:PAS domain S-box-containing protein
MAASWNLRTFSPRGGLAPQAAIEWLASLRGSKLGLRTHLVIFGLAIVVPALLYIGFLLSRYTQQERIANEHRAFEIARALSADVDREITAMITTLQTLATSNALAVGDYQGFYMRAKQALQPRTWNVVLLDMNNQQLVNTRVPWAEPLPVSKLTDPDLPRLAQQTGAPYVTDLFVGTVARRLVYSVSVPVRVGQEMRYALVMSLEPGQLADILGGEGLPDGWIATIADRKNRIMARSRDTKEFLGKPVAAETLERYAGRREGVIITTDFDGRPGLHAFHTSRLTEWRVEAWAPLSIVEGPLWQAWSWFLWSGVALLSLSVLLAFGVGRRMATPIAKLARAGEALGQAKPVTPISSTLREVDELSLVLANAARELDARMGAQAHLAAIVSSSPSAVVSLSPDGVIRTWNAAATGLFGYTPEEAIGQPVHILSPPDSRALFDDLYAQVRAGSVVHMDVVRRHKDGRLIDVSINVAPMYDDAGKLVGISSINRDISERKARERHIEFLMRELSHRSKNLLAVVQAIAGQTARYSPSLEEFQGRFADRVHAMSRSQDLLTARNWRSVSVADLVEAQLAPFIEGARSRIEMTGPELQLRPDVVHGISLALNELATNAAKYGALSVPEGRVVIAWGLSQVADGSKRFRMSWRETGGPPVREPDHKGFGQVVITQMVAASLRAEVRLDFEPGGVCWALDAPAAAALSDQQRA